MRKNKLTKVIGLSAAVILTFSSMTVQAAGESVYTTQRGDNLSKIAQNIYGDKTRWKDIYEANKNVIKDPNKIWANQQLVITGAVVETPQPVVPDTGVTAPQETPSVWAETAPEWKAAGASYVEQNGLPFYQATAFQTQGYRYNGDNLARFEFTGVDGNINSITVRDAEKEGYQVVTISSAKSAYAATHDWGEDPLSTVGMPSMEFCDAYTGRVLPRVEAQGDVELVNTTDLTWGNISYSIDYIEEVNWTYGDWSEWDNEGNSYALATVYETSTVVIPKGYDGLAILTIPYTEGPSADMEYNVFHNDKEEYIMDVWKEGSYLMRVSDLYNILNGQ